MQLSDPGRFAVFSATGVCIGLLVYSLLTPNLNDDDTLLGPSCSHLGLVLSQASCGVTIKFVPPSRRSQTIPPDF